MRFNHIALIAATLMLTACGGNTANESESTPAATAGTPAPATPTDAAAASSTTAVAPGDSMEGMSAEEHAAMGADAAAAGAPQEGNGTSVPGRADGMAGMDHGNMPGMGQGAVADGAQAGWYRGGTFQPCGGTQTYTLSATDDIDARIRTAKMTATDPVYVRLEGSASNGTFKVTRVAQVGSPTPVRDCPMTGTSAQG